MAVERIGGENLDFSSIEVSGNAYLVIGDQETAVQQTFSYRLPDRIRSTSVMGGIKIVVIVNGDTGVTRLGDRGTLMGVGTIKVQLQELQRSLFSLIQHHDDPTLQVISVEGPTTERTCSWVKLSVGGVQSRLCIGDSGEIVHQIHNGRHPIQQSPGELGFGYDDYRKVEGRWIPHLWKVSFDDSLIYRFEIEKITFAPEFDDQTFRVEE